MTKKEVLSMFGLEKSKRKLYEFDLEKDLHKDPKKCKELIAKVEKEKSDLKNRLRTGTDKHEFEDGGIILKGLEALEKVIKKIEGKK